MTFEYRSRQYIEDNGQAITKMERQQVDTDDREDPVYDYPESGQSTIYAIVMPTGAERDKDRDDVGINASGRVEIKISDQITFTEHTRFKIDGINYNLESPEPARSGTRRILLQRLQT